MSSKPKKNPSEAVAEARRKARLVASEAIESLRQVYLNPDAPAPARATAATTVVRIARLLEKDESGEEKQPHEMTPAELDAAVARIVRGGDGGTDEDDEEDTSVFT